MKKIFVLLFLVGMFFRCSEPRVPGVVTSDESASVQTMDSLVEDTTKVLTVLIPRLIDSTRQILVHEIYLSDKREIDRSCSKTGKGHDEVLQITNLIFEDVINKKSVLLTNNQIKISSYNTLTSNYILYRVIDQNYKDKKEIEYIERLYISNVNGTDFTMITRDKETFRCGEWLNAVNRYYFITVEDTNKNGGYFDVIDKMHHYYIEFTEGNYKVVEYNPLEVLNK